MKERWRLLLISHQLAQFRTTFITIECPGAHRLSTGGAGDHCWLTASSPGARCWTCRGCIWWTIGAARGPGWISRICPPITLHTLDVLVALRANLLKLRSARRHLTFKIQNTLAELLQLRISKPSLTVHRQHHISHIIDRLLSLLFEGIDLPLLCINPPQFVSLPPYPADSLPNLLLCRFKKISHDLPTP